MKNVVVALPLALTALLSVAGCSSGSGGDGEDVSFSSDDLSAPTCAPSLANGAVPAKHRAMLDTIAFTEGTANHGGYDGYNVTFGYTYFSSCVHHPDRLVTSGGFSSTAAGRYQFLYSTWTGLHLPNFEPNNQDVGGMKLISQRGVTLPTSRALTATEFANAMSRLNREWASLPGSPFGQPTYSLSTTRRKYCSFAGCDGQTGTDGGGGSSGVGGGGGGSSGGGGGGCVPGTHYCGGDKVSGSSSSLYTCTSGSSGTLVRACPGGCLVLSGSQDVCKGSGGCVAGGFYCGGDKVTGDPTALYRCSGGSSGALVQHCANGCSVSSGRDDACR